MSPQPLQPALQPLPPTLTAETAAPLLHCQPEAINLACAAGELPAVKLGRSWLMVTSDLLAYLAQRGRAEAEERQRARRPAGNVSPIGGRAQAPRPSRTARQTPPALPVVQAGVSRG